LKLKQLLVVFMIGLAWGNTWASSTRIVDADSLQSSDHTKQWSMPAATSALIGNPMSASGDIIYGGTSGAPTRLGKGSDGQVLTLASGLPSWANAGASTTAYYQGYDDHDCSWNCTSTTLGACGTDATCTLTSQVNSNFTVNKATGDYPGIDVSTTRTGYYNVCANLSYYASVNSKSFYVALNDGTTTFKGIQNGASNDSNFSIVVCAIMQITGTPKTVQLYALLTTGVTVTVSGAHGEGPGIVWQINKVY
jgi:hypothetical protein